MTSFWSWYVAALVIFNIVGVWLLLRWTRKLNPDDVKEGEVNKHVYDGIEEYNNPLPRWWLWLFYITVVFAIGYLALYPGLGNFSGLLGWSSDRQHAESVEAIEAEVAPLYKKYAAMDIELLAKDPQATEMGKRLFMTTCFACHGSDARGAPGYPNLTDNDWLYGGDPAAIKTSILKGRKGMMPPLGAVLGESGIEEVVSYVQTLSQQTPEKNELVQAGEARFKMMCAGCHGISGEGNPLFGAPNLTDKIWLYGGSAEKIAETIRLGRSGNMPAHEALLGEDKIHVITAYIYSLSQKKE